MFEKDIVTLIQDTLNISCFPLNVPTSIDTENTCVYRVLSNTRHPEAQRYDYLFRKRTVRLTLLSESYLTNAENENLLVSKLDGYMGKTGGTRFKLIRVIGANEIFNQSQNLYEKSIDIDISSMTDPDYKPSQMSRTVTFTAPE